MLEWCLVATLTIQAQTASPSPPSAVSFDEALEAAMASLASPEGQRYEQASQAKQTSHLEAALDACLRGPAPGNSFDV